MSVRITANNNTRKNIIDLGRSSCKLGVGIRKGLFTIGREDTLHTRKLILSKAKTGRRYFIKGKWHQASAPGEAPANLSGDLQRSVGYKVRGHAEVEVGDGKFYGEYLELGTRKMHPRPHLRKTVRQRGNKNKQIMEDTVFEELQRRDKAGYGT